MKTDLFFASGLAAYSRNLRLGQFTIEAATRACLHRIFETNEKLGSFVHVSEESAMQTASDLDKLLQSGTDLGPLMGVPVAVKDLFTVTGMPTGLGSRADLSGMIGEEGSFISGLRMAGCVILGKTRNTEFAMGGINLTHPTPWNPCSTEEHLTPGGSSSGSAVALASGQCPFAIGGDTGGSVRQPAALCGVVGFKASADRWPLDGIFEFSQTFDSIGYFTATAVDAAYIYGGLTGDGLPRTHMQDIRLGRPSLREFRDLDTHVVETFENAASIVENSGAQIVLMDLPEISEINELSRIIAIEFIAHLGRRRIEALRKEIDPVPMARLEATMDAAEYIHLLSRRTDLIDAFQSSMAKAGLDGWISPTVAHTATPLAELKTVDDAAKWNARTFQFTRFANILDQVGISIPLRFDPTGMPIGLQVCSPHGKELELLSISIAIENCLSRNRL